MSYAEQTPMQIDLTIQPDNCLQIPTGSGVGATVARTTGTSATGAGV
jgi:hypothetical protein